MRQDDADPASEPPSADRDRRSWTTMSRDHPNSEGPSTPVRPGGEPPTGSAELFGTTSGRRHRLSEGPNDIGRGPLASISLDDPSVSRSHCVIHVAGACAWIERASPTNPTLLNGAEVLDRVELVDGDRIEIGLLEFRYRSAPRPSTDGAERPSREGSMRPEERRRSLDHAGMPSRPPAMTDAPHRRSPESSDPTIPDVGAGARSEAVDPREPLGSSHRMRLEIDRSVLIGRDPSSAEVILDHPLVSRLHAAIEVTPLGVFLEDRRSANGTFLDGVRIGAKTPLHPGSLVKIGPFLLRFDGRTLEQVVAGKGLELACRGISRSVRRAGEERLTLLDSISLDLHPGEFVCIIGPSGSGKSTLLGALSGRSPATDGVVEINGVDLYAHFDALKADVAVVPQRDVVHGSLTVEAALGYTARLRLPPDSSDEERRRRIDSVIAQVGLEERRKTPIQRLSGGQLKRTSLANELLPEPSLLFLDEVTSGLDDQSDSEMMKLFREVADAGRTVVCVTHSLAHVAQNATRVVVLAKGGRLAFFGPPEAACAYFGVSSLSGVYRVLDGLPAETWKTRFAVHPLHAAVPAGRSAPAPIGGAAAPPARLPMSRRFETGCRQWAQLSIRLTHLMSLEVRTIATLVAQAVLVGLVLCAVIGRLSGPPDSLDYAGWIEDQMRSESGLQGEALAHARAVQAAFFFLMVAAFWFGANNAAKEIVKERPIYLRERDAGVGPTPYYCSKLAVLGSTTLAQVLALSTGVALYCGLPGVLWKQLLALALLSMTGTAIGLLISAVARSEDRAIAAVPLVLIPQVILSNSIAAVEGIPQSLAKAAVACYWANASLRAALEQATIRLEHGFWTGACMLALQFALFVGLSLAALGLDARRLWIHAALRRAGFGSSP